MKAKDHVFQINGGVSVATITIESIVATSFFDIETPAQPTNIKTDAAAETIRKNLVMRPRVIILFPFLLISVFAIKSCRIFAEKCEWRGVVR